MFRIADPFMFSAPHTSPVYVQIQTDTSKSFDVGPYDRTRFDLVEQFHPLQTASVATGEHLQELRRRVAAGVKSVQPTESTEEAVAVNAAVHDGSTDESAETPSLLRLVFGEWSAWSEWTPCVAGERSRVRACSSRRPALRVICHGDAKEVQKCFSTMDHQIPVASDPWTIEREISGDFKA
ncbi:thrombospondin type 1 domain protein [Ancylostoma caninum]|uniref:Thrombospondin type 1 domain protein n=1 Tax=Ancylostoma caninum TaxID=29170 RepID=A0A368H8T9_ANCCA|nr:thrombospondin type 1 domain protein [Ancylostoma caninum]